MKLFIFAILAIVAVSAETTCEPGKAFKNYCNTCTCGPDGLAKSAPCTRMECVPGMWNEDGSRAQPLSDPTPRDKRQTATCEPGTSFKMACNTCHCPKSGSRAEAACTMMGCPEGVFKEDGTMVELPKAPITKD